MATEEEYIEEYLTAFQNAVIGQAKLAVRGQDLTIPSGERTAALAGFLQASEDISDLKAAHLLLTAAFTPVDPPSSGQLATAKRLAAQSGQAIARARQAAAIVTAIAALVDGWRQI
jgi:GAF domain-containing protein